MTEPHGPLQGVKVVACSTAQAGTVPYMLMADLGAEVIKIEVPEGGDNSRGSTVLPGMPSTYFETNNRGVRSVTLNLKRDEGREILRKLVARADIFGQNFRPGAAEKNGFGYEDLRKVNPKLVYVSISGYGPNGPNAHLPGTDSMAQALGGIAEAYSTPGQKLKTGIVSVADETCAILAFGGALAALTYARVTGIGQKVDCSLLGGQIRLMGWTLTTAMWRGKDPVTGQARLTGAAERPGISRRFNDRDGEPPVVQLGGNKKWRGAMSACGFYEGLRSGQKVDCSLLGGQIRLMGWTLTTAMWRGKDPVTGQARITGTAERPGISSSFNDRDGKPLVFQLGGNKKWRDAMSACGFYEVLEAGGFGDLGIIITSEEKRATLLRMLDELFATGPRDDWVARLRAADIVSAPINTLLEASNDPDVVANGYVTEIDYPKHGKRLKVHGSPWHFSETPANIGIAPELGAHNDEILSALG